VFNKGLIPSFANPKDKFLSFLSEIGPNYVTKFRNIQKQDTGLAKFIRSNTDQKGPDQVRYFSKTLGKSYLPYTPSDIGTTTGFNLDLPPEGIRGVLEIYMRGLKLKCLILPNLSKAVDILINVKC
jgi:hypothetical protein